MIIWTVCEKWPKQILIYADLVTVSQSQGYWKRYKMVADHDAYKHGRYERIWLKSSLTSSNIKAFCMQDRHIEDGWSNITGSTDPCSTHKGKKLHRYKWLTKRTASHTIAVYMKCATNKGPVRMEFTVKNGMEELNWSSAMHNFWLKRLPWAFSPAIPKSVGVDKQIDWHSRGAVRLEELSEQGQIRLSTVLVACMTGKKRNETEMFHT